MSQGKYPYCVHLLSSLFSFLIFAGEQERDGRLILLSVVSGTFLKRTALEPTLRKILAHSWHSFVLPTGMNGMCTNGGAKALVLSSSSVTWVMFFT